jgi:hypothetical protein
MVVAVEMHKTGEPALRRDVVEIVNTRFRIGSEKYPFSSVGLGL